MLTKEIIGVMIVSVADEVIHRKSIKSVEQQHES
jgi:hypothetical protein